MNTRTKLRVAVPAIAAATAVAAGSASAVATSQQAKADTTAGAAHSVLRPRADVKAFAVAHASSAAAALAQNATSPHAVKGKPYLSAVAADSTTTVTFANPAVAKTAASKAWFYAQTGAGTSLRVDVLWNGPVHATTVLPAGRGAGWHSISFSAPNQAAVNDLQLRFTAVGGASVKVNAAYVSLGRKGKPALTLRPTGVVAPFTVLPNGTAAAALADAVSQPARVAGDKYLQAKPGGRTSVVALARPASPAQSVASTAWFYGGTGAGTQLRVDVVWDGVAHAARVVPANQGNRWQPITFSVPTAAAATDLQLRFTSIGGGAASVRAAYADFAQAPSDRQYINDYLSGLSPITASPSQDEHATGPTSAPTTSEALPDPSAKSGKSRYSCTSTPYSVSSSPEQIVALNPDSNKLWLGGLLQGQGYASGLGSLRELPIRKRAPLTIYTDLLGPKAAITVQNPDPASVQAAIGTLVQRATEAKVPVPARATYTQTDEKSSSQALLKLGISAKYLGGSGTAKLDADRNAQESSVMASFMQRLFTVSIVTPSAPADYFSKDFGKADLKEQQDLGRVASDNPPVVVGSISFGRVLLYSVTSSTSTDKLSAALNAAYSGGAASGSIDVTAEQKQILDNARYQVVTLGGDETEALTLIKSHKLGDYFTGHTNLATAVPISYQVNNIGNDSAARFTETTNYNLTQCQVLPNQAVVIGQTVQVTNPNAFLVGPRNPADIYGFVSVNDTATWTVGRSNPITIQKNVQSGLNWNTSSPGGVQNYDLYYDPANGPTSFNIHGNINCKLAWWEIGDDPSNSYDWTWDINQDGTGAAAIDGNSAHCNVQLRQNVSFVKPIVDWQP